MKRMLFTGALILASLSMVFATGESEDMASKDLQPLSVLCWDRGTVPSDEGTITDNWFTRWVNEEMAERGIVVEFKPVPRNKEGEILPTYLAAGTAPDVCFSYDKNMIIQLADDGGLVDFTDYVGAKTPSILKFYSADDLQAGQINGRQYMFRGKMSGDSAMELTWIRQDWLDKVGMDVPEDLDSFYDMLVAFRDQDPENLGEKNIPWAMKRSSLWWDSVVMAAFVADRPVGEKMVIPSPLWPEAKDALRFLNTCYNEGLLGNFILDKDDSLYKQKLVLGEIGAFTDFAHWPFHSAYGELYKNLQKNVPDARIVPATPFQKVSDEDWVILFRPSMYSYAWFAPKNKVSPDVKVTYIDFLAGSEYMNIMSYGEEGTDYVMKENSPVKNTESWNKRVSWIQPQYNGTGTANHAFYDQPQIQLPTRWDFGPYQDLWLKAIDMSRQDEHPWGKPEINALMPMALKYTGQATKAWDNQLPLIITASPEAFDKTFEDAVENYKANGGEAIAEEAVRLYREMYGE